MRSTRVSENQRSEEAVFLSDSTSVHRGRGPPRKDIGCQARDLVIRRKGAKPNKLNAKAANT